MPDKKLPSELELRWQRWGRSVDEIGLAATGYRSVGMQVTGMGIRMPREERGEFLVTIRALDSEGAPFVAFHGASDLGEALTGLWNRLQNGTLRWKPDEWAR